MAVVIRLRSQGSVSRRRFRIVAADGQAPRDGKYLEALGWYDPLAKDALRLNIKTDRVQHWLDKGAQMTDKVESLLEEVSPEAVKALKAKAQTKAVKLAQKRRKSK